MGADIRAASTDAEKCDVLTSLANCVSNIAADLSLQERLVAETFVDTVKTFQPACEVVDLPAVVNHLRVKVERESDAHFSRERRAETTTIWNVNSMLNKLRDSVVTKKGLWKARDEEMDKHKVAIMRMAGLRDDIMEEVNNRMDTFSSDTQKSINTVLSSLKSVTTSINDLTMARIGNVEAKMKTIKAAVSKKVQEAISEKENDINDKFDDMTSSVDDAVSGVQKTVDDLKATVNDKVNAVAEKLPAISTKVDKLMAVFEKTPFMNFKLPVYRWAVWSSYAQNYGWYMNNNNAMFGGVHPSQWGDGNGRAYQMSSNKDILRTLFNKRGYGGWNTNVYAEEWYYYSSTNSRQVGALFRIRNTKSSNIDWRTYFYYSSFGGWGESASVARNGQNMWDTQGNCGYCTVNVNVNIPANRVSTVIFITGAGHPSGTRTTLLGFYNNCLRLPDGLEYVDDMDYATGGWEK